MAAQTNKKSYISAKKIKKESDRILKKKVVVRSLSPAQRSYVCYPYFCLAVVFSFFGFDQRLRRNGDCGKEMVVIIVRLKKKKI